MRSALFELECACDSHPYPFLVSDEIDSASDLNANGIGAIKKSVKVGEEECVERCWVSVY